MPQCNRCKASAKYVASKRFSIFRIEPRFMCDQHKMKFERTEDLFLILALVLSVSFLLASLYNDILQKDHANQQTLMHQEQVFAEHDLDRDGRVSLFEAQADDLQLENFRKIGYPFARIILPGEPTKSVYKRVDTQMFTKAILPSQDGEKLVSLFHHPRLIKNFLTKYTAENITPFLKAIYLTHDMHIAYVLDSQENGAGTMICLESVEQELYDKIAALPAK